MEADLIYYRRRSAEERTAAAAAHDKKVRAVHLSLSLRSDEHIVALASKPKRSEIHLVTAA